MHPDGRRAALARKGPVDDIRDTLADRNFDFPRVYQQKPLIEGGFWRREAKWRPVGVQHARG